MPPSSPSPPSVRPPHPLTLELIAALAGRAGARVCDFATGNGRNAAALRAAGLVVCAVADAQAARDPLPAFDGDDWDGLISTHGFLHGDAPAIARRIAATVAHLSAGAPFYVTFGSTHDPRCGEGTQLGPRTFAPSAGEESGVAHTYYDAPALHALLQPYVAIVALDQAPSAHGIHWQLRACKRELVAQ